MPNRLTNLSLDENSLVDVPAHPGAEVVLFKRYEGDVSKGDPGANDLHVERPLGEEEEEDEDRKRRFSPRKSHRRNLKPTGEGENPMSEDEKTFSKSDLPAEAVDYIDQMEAYADELEASLAKALGEADEADEASVDDIIKNADPAVQAVFEAVAKRAEESEARLAEVEKSLHDERDRQMTEHFTGIAKSFRALPVGASADEFGEVLKGLATKAPEEFEVVKSLLTRADSALSESVLMTEAGAFGHDNDSEAGSQVEKMAADKVSKGLAPNMETARVLVMDEHPDLYNEMTK